MKLTNIQRETIVKDIYNTILKAQADYIKTEIDTNLAKKIAEYKKTPEYKIYLKLEEVNKLDGVYISLDEDSLFSVSNSSWRNSDLTSLEELVTYKYEEELKSTLKIPNKQDIEDKLILSTIGNFDFEKFKQSILADFGI